MASTRSVSRKGYGRRFLVVRDILTESRLVRHPKPMSSRRQEISISKKNGSERMHESYHKRCLQAPGGICCREMKDAV